ncbi:MAG TPA: hypothetical protein VHA11_12455, partial [Bryobacteraceae bacterium]|nr:hypothetical protein [Bryobacteraceae bacterium]
MKIFLSVLLALVLGIPLVLLLVSASPAVTVDPQVSVLGQDTPIVVKVASPHGVRNVRAEIEQNGNRYPVFETSRPSRRVFFFGKSETSPVFRFSAGKKQAPALKDGKARLLVSVQANDFRASTVTVAQGVEVNTQPPRVSVDGAQHYINQGGVELVTFTVGGYWTNAGVRVGPYTFRSFAMPGRPASERFSIFAFPWDVPADTVPVVFASNPSGAEARGHFWYKVFPKAFHTREMELTDAFLAKVVDQIDPNGSGDNLQRFLKINSEMRKQNNQTLRDLRLKTEEKLLWSGAFWRYGKT